MANDPVFATLNHPVSDLGIPRESVDQRIGITPSESFSHEPSFLLALIWFTRAERVWLASRLVRKNNFLASWNKTEAAFDNYLGVSGRIHLS
jgi:hypothetical protein